MAEGSRVAIGIKKESVWGEKASGQYKYINYSEESLALNIQKDKSKRILPTRENSKLVKKTKSTEGGFVTQLQFGNTDEVFESSLMSEWSDVANNGGGGFLVAGSVGTNNELIFTTESIVGTGGTITIGTAKVFNIKKDQVIFVTGAIHPANNGSFIVKNVAGRVVTVNSPLTTTTYESLTTIKGDVIRNDSVISSFTIEREHTDISKFLTYIGKTIATTQITFEPENEVMVNYSFIGKDEEQNNVTSSTGTPIDRVTTPDFIVGDNVEGIYFDYSIVENCLIGKLDFTIDNKTEGRKSIAVFGTCAPRIKDIDVSGSIMLWFQEFTEYLKYVNDTLFNITVIQSDSVGNKYAFTLCNVQYSTGTMNTTSSEDEVPEEHEFSCSTNGVFTVQICKASA